MTRADLRRATWAGVFAGAIAVLCVAVGWTDVRRVGRRETGDFVHFYAAAEAVTRGQDPYAAGTRGYIYPPLVAFAFQPLVRLGIGRAAAVMLGVNVAVTLAAAVGLADVLLRRLSGRGVGRVDLAATLGVAFAALLLDADKVKGEWQMWQTDVFMVGGVVLAMRWQHRRPVLAGVALGAAANIKYLPLVMVPYLLVRRRFAVVGGVVLGAAAFALLPAAGSGWAGTLHQWQAATRGLARMAGADQAGHEAAEVHSVADALSCSITSAVARATGSAAGGFAGAIGIGGMTLAGAAWMYRCRGTSLLSAGGPAVEAVEWPVVFAGILAFCPQTNTRHLFDAVLVTAAAAVLLACADRRVSRVPVAVGTAALVAGFLFPMGHRDAVGRASAVGWLRLGGPCWCLLAAAMTLLWTGLGQARSRQETHRPGPAAVAAAG